MLYRSTIQLLRFHFSFFLLPVYLFALAETPVLQWKPAVLLFVILHLLVYPASNGYNSYMDRDETPIGGLQNPMKPTHQLYRLSVVMDLLSVILSLFISLPLALGILLYIVASRCYSYRGIRLKRYPVTGFLTVFFFQGAHIFMISYFALQPAGSLPPSLLSAFTSSLLIGALYPLTQVYQYEADQKDGVTTLSFLLGKRGSFVFSAVLFLLATLSLFLRFQQTDSFRAFYLFLIITFPVVLFFLYWGYRVWRDPQAADFRNSLRMNAIATACTTAYFITLILIRH